MVTLKSGHDISVIFTSFQKGVIEPVSKIHKLYNSLKESENSTENYGL